MGGSEAKAMARAYVRPRRKRKSKSQLPKERLKVRSSGPWPVEGLQGKCKNVIIVDTLLKPGAPPMDDINLPRDERLLNVKERKFLSPQKEREPIQVRRGDVASSPSLEISAGQLSLTLAPCRSVAPRASEEFILESCSKKDKLFDGAYVSVPDFRIEGLPGWKQCMMKSKGVLRWKLVSNGAGRAGGSEGEKGKKRGRKKITTEDRGKKEVMKMNAKSGGGNRAVKWAPAPKKRKQEQSQAEATSGSQEAHLGGKSEKRLKVLAMIKHLRKEPSQKEGVIDQVPVKGGESNVSPKPRKCVSLEKLKPKPTEIRRDAHCSKKPEVKGAEKEKVKQQRKQREEKPRSSKGIQDIRKNAKEVFLIEKSTTKGMTEQNKAEHSRGETTEPENVVVEEKRKESEELMRSEAERLKPLEERFEKFQLQRRDAERKIEAERQQASKMQRELLERRKEFEEEERLDHILGSNIQRENGPEEGEVERMNYASEAEEDVVEEGEEEEEEDDGNDDDDDNSQVESGPSTTSPNMGSSCSMETEVVEEEYDLEFEIHADGAIDDLLPPEPEPRNSKAKKVEAVRYRKLY